MAVPEHTTAHLILYHLNDWFFSRQPAFYWVINHLVTHHWSLPSQSVRGKSIINDLPSSHQTAPHWQVRSNVNQCCFHCLDSGKQSHVITVCFLRSELISFSVTEGRRLFSYLWVWRSYVRRWRRTPSAPGGSLPGCQTVSTLSSNRGTAERRGNRSAQTERRCISKQVKVVRHAGFTYTVVRKRPSSIREVQHEKCWEHSICCLVPSAILYQRGPENRGGAQIWTR